MDGLVKRTREFMSANPSVNEIEVFYVNEILPHTKDSIEDLLS